VNTAIKTSALPEPRAQVRNHLMQIKSPLCGAGRTPSRLRALDRNSAVTALSWYIDRKDAAAAFCKQQTNQTRGTVVI
jgi:hypothetical protein